MIGRLVALVVVLTVCAAVKGARVDLPSVAAAGTVEPAPLR